MMAELVRPIQPTDQTGASVAGSVRSVAQTSQIGAMVVGSASQPQLVPFPYSAASGRIDELANFEPPYNTKSYGKPLFSPPMPQDVWNDLLRTNHHYITQTMSTTDPMTHRLNASGQTSTGNYEANLARMKEDLASMLKSKLRVDVGRSRL